MGSNPHANGGELLQPLSMPNFHDYAVAVLKPGSVEASHVWRQDHNGFSHQDPGFIDHVANKKSDIVRIYLPPDANCLLSVADHCLRSRNYINVIIAGKHPGVAVARH